MWEFVITKAKGQFNCWTYRYDIGSVFEGTAFFLKEAERYYRSYAWLLNRGFPRGRSLIGYQVRREIE